MLSRLLLLGLIFSPAASLISAADAPADYPITPVPFTAVKLHDAFWSPRIHTNHTVTIPIALKQCYDTGRVDNFLKAAHEKPGPFGTVFPFDDTDLYKIIEGISYTIQSEPDAELSAKADELIAIIGRAQEPDGYLYTARSIDPAHPHAWSGATRWEKEADLSHELYNSGHLFEAAVAHWQATGKRTFLDIAIKNADLLCDVFGPGKRSVAPGHQIVEMGLVKLSRATGQPKYLALAQFFLEQRGTGKDYSQNHLPVTKQRDAVGHAVRATYMYSGMADVAALTGNQDYQTAIEAIWQDVALHKLAVTGGIGSQPEYEGFGERYDLPNLASYNETCAAIGNVYWNQRLFLKKGESRFIDVLERSLYNGVISGVSVSGDGFFYPNPLESRGNFERAPWFGCACCPSNLCRFLPSVPGYVYAKTADRIFVNLYVASDASISLAAGPVRLTQTTAYPWSGDVEVRVDAAPAVPLDLAFRLPAWARNDTTPGALYTASDESLAPIALEINGRPAAFVEENGYGILRRVWTAGDQVSLRLPMPVRRVRANEAVQADRGRVCLQKGPVVYAWEQPDNPGVNLFGVVLGHDAKVTDTFTPALLGGVGTLTAQGVLYTRTAAGDVKDAPVSLHAIPYAVWANRGASDMAVWLPEKFETLSLPQVTLASSSRLSASTPTPALGAVNDAQLPSKPNDHAIPSFVLHPSDGKPVWLQYDFAKPVRIASTRIYWQSSKPWGDIDYPAEVQVLIRKGTGDWVPLPAGHAVAAPVNGVTELALGQVEADAVRLELKAAPSNAIGVYEWEVQAAP